MTYLLALACGIVGAYLTDRRRQHRHQRDADWLRVTHGQDARWVILRRDDFRHLTSRHQCPPGSQVLGTPVTLQGNQVVVDR